jgi:hypothetical protein
MNYEERFILLANMRAVNSFEGHAGRPGERGGSVAKDAGGSTTGKTKNEYPRLDALKLSNDDIRAIKIVSENIKDTVSNPGAVFPESKGYQIVEVNGLLNGKPVKFTEHRQFY